MSCILNCYPFLFYTFHVMTPPTPCYDLFTNMSPVFRPASRTVVSQSKTLPLYLRQWRTMSILSSKLSRLSNQIQSMLPMGVLQFGQGQLRYSRRLSKLIDDEFIYTRKESSVQLLSSVFCHCIQTTYPLVMEQMFTVQVYCCICCISNGANCRH